jgi:hypothetical protein
MNTQVVKAAPTNKQEEAILDEESSRSLSLPTVVVQCLLFDVGDDTKEKMTVVFARARKRDSARKKLRSNDSCTTRSAR